MLEGEVGLVVEGDKKGGLRGPIVVLRRDALRRLAMQGLRFLSSLPCPFLLLFIKTFGRKFRPEIGQGACSHDLKISSIAKRKKGYFLI